MEKKLASGPNVPATSGNKVETNHHLGPPSKKNMGCIEGKLPFWLKISNFLLVGVLLKFFPECSSDAMFLPAPRVW
jgi:hypothetical protein